MGRWANSATKAASRSALAAASLVAVCEQKRWIAARMIASGNGTRSAVPIRVETKLMEQLPLWLAHDPCDTAARFSGSCVVRRQGKDLVGTRLIRAIALAAGAQH